jgi:hypothetical protein
MVINKGPDKVKALPHHAAAVINQGFTDEEKALKQTRSRKGCIGTCRTDNESEPQNRRRVPWIMPWIERSRESKRKAGVDSVAKVNGKNRSICRAVDSLWILL